MSILLAGTSGKMVHKTIKRLELQQHRTAPERIADGVSRSSHVICDGCNL